MLGLQVLVTAQTIPHSVKASTAPSTAPDFLSVTSASGLVSLLFLLLEHLSTDLDGCPLLAGKVPSTTSPGAIFQTSIAP